jgi:uncharacterized surface protein with fasciclin (FAS1) repeats
MMHRSKTFLGIAALSAGALLLAACSDDDDNGAATTTAAEAPTTTAAEEMEDTEAADETIVEIAAGSDDFTTLVAALTEADLVETLSGDGPFTVFAPTDDAFAALPEGLVESLLEPENRETLVKILTYHVVAAQVMAADVEAGTVETVEGQSFTIEVDGGDVFIVDGQGNRVQVVQTDIVGSNGVIHVIDGVLLPADVTLPL